MKRLEPKLLRMTPSEKNRQLHHSKRRAQRCWNGTLNPPAASLQKRGSAILHLFLRRSYTTTPTHYTKLPHILQSSHMLYKTGRSNKELTRKDQNHFKCADLKTTTLRKNAGWAPKGLRNVWGERRRQESKYHFWRKLIDDSFFFSDEHPMPNCRADENRSLNTP